MTAPVLDLFAGPGGWDVAARTLGVDPVGFEYDADACATRAAAGLRTVGADVGAYPLDHLRATGLIASPPCTAFSRAGRGHGRKVGDELVAAVDAGAWDARPDPDPNVWLVLDVGRWIEALQPEWVALEQVPAVLPIWQAYVRWLEARGYSAWAGRLHAEEYGVPQTRQRAALIASRTRKVGAPTPTHQRYQVRQADGGRHGLLAPWVSMAEALGWDEDDPRDCTAPWPPTPTTAPGPDRRSTPP